MAPFNNMTIMAAARILEGMHTQAECDGTELEWGLEGRTSGSVLKRFTEMANIAVIENPVVFSLEGRQTLSKAMVMKAVSANQHNRKNNEEEWKKLVIGLRLDGFELQEERIETKGSWGQEEYHSKFMLRSMMPGGVPEVDMSEAESEMITLLKKYGFAIPTGHLQQAINNFSNGQWASANGDLRSFFEGLLNEIAVKFGCDASKKTSEKRHFLGTLNPPFLYEDYNEWHSSPQKPQYIQGLWSRMHPHGAHPGLSEEDDCTFRLQIALISARLFLRRFDQRMKAE